MTNTKKQHSRALALLLTLFLMMLPATPLLAGMLDTDTLITTAGAQSERMELAQRLQTTQARDALVRMGVDPADAQLRVDRLSDAEVATLNARMDELPAGGSVLGVVAAVFIILVITDALGYTNVFNFVRSDR